MWTGTESTISYNPEFQGFFHLETSFGRIGVVFDLGADKIQKILPPGFTGSFLSGHFSSLKPLLEKYLEAWIFNRPLPYIPDDRLDWTGLTPFQISILCYLKNHSRRGELISYSELALKAGFPKASRACGRALANNPFPLVIPCHRVICQNGEIGGFMGGRQKIILKKKLLRMEGFENWD